MGATRNHTGREALLRDVLEVDQPGPELLVRYAQAPDSLDPEERRSVEEALARFPATADQLRVLRGFDAELLDDELEPEPLPATPPSGPLDALRRFLGALAGPQPAWVWVPAAVATALLVAFLSVRLVQTREVNPLQQELAEVQAQLREERAELAKARGEAAEQRSKLDLPHQETEARRLELAAMREQIRQREEQTRLAKEGPARPGTLEGEPGPKREATPRGERAPKPAGTTSEIHIAMAGPLRYVPPPRAGPLFRGVGRMRSVLSALPELWVLAPEHQGQTIKRAPAVYWFLSETMTRPIELTVSDPESDELVLEVTLPGPHTAGIHGVDLAARGVRLSLARTYEWSVVILSKNAAGGDVISEGAIRRVAPSKELEDELERAGAAGAARVYAQHGLWYDALAEISARVESAPGDARLRELRAGLLEQVGLEAAAAYDRDR